MALSQVTMRDFHGPDFWSYQWSMTLHSDPILQHARACSLAWTCMRTPAGRGATKCERNTTMRAVHAVVVWNLELTCRLLWASFQFKPRSWTSSVLLTMDRGKLNRAASVRESNLIRPEVWNHFRRGTKQNAHVQRWHVFQLDVPGHLQQKHPSKFVGPMVVTQEPGLRLPPAAPAAALVSLSLPLCVCVCVCVCCSLSVVFLLDSVKVDTAWIWLCILCHC